MHTRKEIDNILDNIIELIAKQKDLNKESPETDTELQELFNQINKKTLNGERAKGMWTDSPEFLAGTLY